MSASKPISVAQLIDLSRGVNLWQAPDWASLFGIQLEGRGPSAGKRKAMQAKLDEQRRQWAPTAAAWDQLHAIAGAVVGRRIVIKIWDPIIVALDEDEGPFPIQAFCGGVDTRMDSSGVLQAYLKLEAPVSLENPFGTDGREQHLVPADTANVHWVNLGDLYEIIVLANDDAPYVVAA